MNVNMPEWAPSERVRRLAERRGIEMPSGLRYSTLGEALDAHPELSTVTHNLLLRAYSQLRGDPYFYRDRIRATPFSVVVNDIHTKSLLTVRCIGPVRLAEIKRVFLGD